MQKKPLYSVEKSEAYKTSRDYKHLKELLDGDINVVCFINYDASPTTKYVLFVVGKVSDSQIMEVAAKLVIASNPTVNIFRIGRGESLGTKRLQSIVNLAKQNGFQGFIEQVERGQETITIEEYREI